MEEQQTRTSLTEQEAVEGHSLSEKVAFKHANMTNSGFSDWVSSPQRMDWKPGIVRWIQVTGAAPEL